MTGLTSPPYTDEDARIAVDGSDVAVEEANQANVADVASNAENADQLGGQDPSAFETPNGTQSSTAAGGYETILDVSNVTLNGYTNEQETYYPNFGNALIDEVQVSFSQTSQIDLTIDVAGMNITSGGNYNTNPTVENQADIVVDTVSADDEDFDLNVVVHKIPAGYHAHSI